MRKLLMISSLFLCGAAAPQGCEPPQSFMLSECECTVTIPPPAPESPSNWRQEFVYPVGSGDPDIVTATGPIVIDEIAADVVGDFEVDLRVNNLDVYSAPSWSLVGTRAKFSVPIHLNPGDVFGVYIVGSNPPQFHAAVFGTR